MDEERPLGERNLYPTQARTEMSGLVGYHGSFGGPASPFDHAEGFTAQRGAYGFDQAAMSRRQDMLDRREQGNGGIEPLRNGRGLLREPGGGFGLPEYQ